uniref:NADH-ubiquinone oxidoreductase chain 4L n=1 Tax=Hypera postica TaxID=36757 RepID=J9PGQ3_9CUCU|nr:NADH dehydrogenase subunit 4L [Hypera postica]
MLIYVYTFFIMFFSSIIVFVTKRKHLLIMLLSLESAVVSIYVGLFFFLSTMGNEFFFSMVFLSICVCEGALGLSLLVLMIRVHGNDLVTTFNSLW